MKYKLEYPELANALYLALKPDAFYQTLEASIEGDSTNQKEAMLAYMDYSILEAQRFGDFYIPEQQHYGVSVWSKPIDIKSKENKKQLKKEFMIRYLGEKPYRIYQDICKFMSGKSSPLAAQDAWYLSIVGVVPDFQGQGLGPGLIENVLEKTDEMGVATYLETFTPRNMSFYQRLGYKTLSSFKEPLTQAEYWLMQRPPPNSREPERE